MAVATSVQPQEFSEIGNLVGLKSEQVGHQIGQLSDGRGKQPGLNLLTREKGLNGRSRQVSLSRTGRAIVNSFVFPPLEGKMTSGERSKRASEFAAKKLFPLFKMLAKYASTMSLGTFCVLLLVTLEQEQLGYGGTPVKKLAARLQIPNLPRHIKLLVDGPNSKNNLGLITQAKSNRDRRMALPVLTNEGIRLIGAVASMLINRTPSTPMKVKREVLEKLNSPDDIADLPPESFEPFSRDGEPN